MRQLTRKDIVGRRIEGVFRSDWRTLEDVKLCDVFVVLDSGTAFQLVCPTDRRDTPILAVDLTSHEVYPVVFDAKENCLGEIVKAVAYDGWSSIGLCVESNRILVIESLMPRWLGPCVLPMTSYVFDDIIDFWDPSIVYSRVSDERDRTRED